MIAPPSRRNTILLHEDDAVLAREIVLAFEKEGERVDRVDSEAALRACIARKAGALILDRMIGDRDSLEILQQLRREGDCTPVVVISSLAAVDDRIEGLKAGGDDYLVKPFAMGELVARVAALRRRAEAEPRSVLAAGPLRMDLIAQRVTRGDRLVALLPREYALLQYLMRHAGEVVTRAMLLEDVWHVRHWTHTNVVDVHVGNLRRKIESDGESRLIHSVRGLGFTLGENGDAS